MLSELFTATCHYCAKRITNARDIFCIECYGELPKTSYQFSNSNPVKDKFKGLVQIQMAGAYVYYHHNEMIQKMLYEIKYNQNTTLAYELGYLCGMDLKETFRDHVDLIIPIPLHNKKFHTRGYNQTAIIAEGMGKAAQIEYSDTILERSIYTDTQTNKNRTQRFQNVDNIFKIKNLIGIHNKKIMVIDDVITTGATLTSAIDIIQEAHPKEIHVFAFAAAFQF